VVPR